MPKKRDPATKPGPVSPAPKPKLPLDLTSGEPEDIWHDYFSKRTPNPADVREIIRRLHDAEKHEHVIAAIGAALVNNQSQPWMYDVLALSMEIAGRPKAEVERAVFSGVDLSGVNFPSMMMSAAYLTRFERPKAALHLYRQASKLSMVRPEPYILGLKLAQQEKDYDGIQWAIAGILKYAWLKDYGRLHKQARDAALNAAQELRKLNRDREAKVMDLALADALKRDLELKLEWTGAGDLDLLVEEPPGTICSFDNQFTEGGGVLVHDGYGPEPENSFEQYVCPFGLPGDYRVHVRHTWGNIVGNRAKLTIVRYKGTSHEQTRSVTVTLGEDDTVIRLSLKQGRRRELAQVWQNESPRMQKPRKRTLLQMLGRMDKESHRAARDFQNSRNDVGFQPVISVLSEGVTMSALAVVSGDRRYVRITTAPAFTNITDVFTFTTQGGGNQQQQLGGQGGQGGLGGGQGGPGGIPLPGTGN